MATQIKTAHVVGLVGVLGLGYLLSRSMRSPTGAMLAKGWNTVRYIGPTARTWDALAQIAEYVEDYSYWDEGSQDWTVPVWFDYNEWYDIKVTEDVFWTLAGKVL